MIHGLKWVSITVKNDFDQSIEKAVTGPILAGPLEMIIILGKKSDYTFPNVFGAMNPNPTSELLHHVRFLRNPKLQVQKARFFSIFGVKLHRELIFFLNSLRHLKVSLLPFKAE